MAYFLGREDENTATYLTWTNEDVETRSVVDFGCMTGHQLRPAEAWPKDPVEVEGVELVGAVDGQLNRGAALADFKTDGPTFPFYCQDGEVEWPQVLRRFRLHPR